MALSAVTVWEVRPNTGSDTNGGGWVAGATGTDFSQQAAPQYALTNGVTNGTTTVSTASAATNMVGNVAYIEGGTGAITGDWYHITAASAGVSITVDRSTGLTAGTGVTINVGGALQTIPTLFSKWVSGNKAFVKAESTITTTAGFTNSIGGTLTATGNPNRIIGYTSTRGDRGQPLIELSTNSGLTAIGGTVNNFFIENFQIDCKSLTTSKGISITGTGILFQNVKVSNFTAAGIEWVAAGTTSIALADGNEITGGTSAATAALIMSSGSSNIVRNNNIHDNACTAALIGASSQILDNLITNNTGASSDGISVSTRSWAIQGNTIHGCGRHGINITTGVLQVCALKNNILTSNGGYGIQGYASSGCPPLIQYDGNAYYNNTSGTRNNMDDVTTTIDSINPYTNTLDIICSVDPYTNSAGGDFTLNNTAGGGADIRGNGQTKTFLGATGTSYRDMGVFQHQDPAGGGSDFYIGGM